MLISKYSLSGVVDALRKKKGVKIDLGKGEITVSGGAHLGIHLLGGLDFLKKLHSFSVKFQKSTAKRVKSAVEVEEEHPDSIDRARDEMLANFARMNHPQTRSPFSRKVFVARQVAV